MSWTPLRFLISAVFLVGTLLSFVSVKGTSFQVVLSGSMEPDIKAGSLVVAHSVAPSAYRVGDVISFRVFNMDEKVVTHRIASIGVNSTGENILETKGDANTNGDGWQISVGQVIGKKVAVIPWLGYWCRAIQSQVGFWLCAVTLFLFGVAAELRYLLRFSWSPSQIE